MTWSYVLTAHWNDPDTVGRRCVQCDHAATHRAEATHGVSGAKDNRWFCTNHAASFAAERGLDFAKVRPFTTRAPLTFTIPTDTPIAHCGSCRAPVRWIVTEAGKRMPCNPDGTSHFATCPNAAAHRKPRA